MSKLNDKHDATIVKRGGGRHQYDEHGGAWKVAFADFCLALLALFLVLWLMAAREKEAAQNMLKDLSAGQLEGPGKRPDIDSSPGGSLIERFPTMHDGTGPGKDGQAAKVSYDSPADLAALSKKLEKMSEEAGLASNLEATVTPFGLRVMLHDTDKQGMFMRGSALPTGRFARLLQKMGPLFAQMENQMLIVGHTDSVQYNFADRTGMSNWSLSSNRAMAARAQLLTGGMRGDSVLQVVGMADRAPIDEAHPAAAVNRRIELMILTRAQSRTVAAMFGAPGATESLADGVSVSAAGKQENAEDSSGDMTTLRGQLAK
ncbi:MAG: histidine kinase [Massilia sp.]|nr:histidine kinase [Massilia sp.]MDB5790364.1 histidine kinase [Massilia sp.]